MWSRADSAYESNQSFEKVYGMKLLRSLGKIFSKIFIEP
jgi:hypothetical protein